METLIALFLAATATYHLPSGLLSGLCYVESHHNPAAIHHDDGRGDSLGICQIKEPSARQVGFRGTRAQLMRPEVNIKYAARYLAHQVKRYNGDYAKAVTAYNKGTSNSTGISRYQSKVFNQWKNHESSKIINTTN
jgi:soluble lytic murein transglycosylase-like protein